MKIKTICMFLILLSILIIVPITSGISLKTIETQNTGQRNEFEAELGFRGDDEPFIVLDGQIRQRWRFYVVSGTATAGENQVRFQGYFRGSFLILQIPLRGRIQSVYGSISFNEDRTSFSGSWRARGLGTSGWITGTLSI